MPVSNHPLYEEWSRAYDRLTEAHERLKGELRKGERGIIDAAKLDHKKAQEVYDEVSARL